MLGCCFVCINHTASFTERLPGNHSARERGGVGRLVTYPAAELSPNHILRGHCFHFECLSPPSWDVPLIYCSLGF